MSDLARYTCPPELLPGVEAALAAAGYVVVAAPRRPDDPTPVVMESGAAQVLLAPCPEYDIAEIEVWGAAQAAAVALLESLPFELERHTSS